MTAHHFLAKCCGSQLNKPKARGMTGLAFVAAGLILVIMAGPITAESAIVAVSDIRDDQVLTSPHANLEGEVRKPAGRPEEIYIGTIWSSLPSSSRMPWTSLIVPAGALRQTENAMPAK